jgi:hypothetical protein
MEPDMTTKAIDLKTLDAIERLCLFVELRDWSFVLSADDDARDVRPWLEFIKCNSSEFVRFRGEQIVMDEVPFAPR